MLNTLVTWLALALTMLVVGLGPARAVEPGEMLPDAGLEARARTISSELRCLVCQNQSIDDSNAPLAKDLRLLVRERLKAGDTDAEVMERVVDRYGEFVLLRPSFALHNLLLWLTPLLVLVAAAIGMWRHVRSARVAGPTAASAPLTADEKERLGKLLDGSSG